MFRYKCKLGLRMPQPISLICAFWEPWSLIFVECLGVELLGHGVVLGHLSQTRPDSFPKCTSLRFHCHGGLVPLCPYQHFFSSALL